MIPLLLKPIKHQHTIFLLIHNTIINNRFFLNFTNTVSDFVQAWGLKYLLVLLVPVVNREQTTIAQGQPAFGDVHPVEALPCPSLPGET